MSERVGVQRFLLLVFFLSGACGLVYEVVWVRMLALVFGSTVYAVSATLTAFMAGLALGSLLFGRLIDRWRNPLRVFALLQAGIGVYAFAVSFLFLGLDSVSVYLHAHFGPSFYLFSLLRFAVAFLVLLIPTTLIGASFPVMSKTYVRRLREVGGGVGVLYSVNTFGAVVGCFLAGFLLLGCIGVRGSLWLAGSINLLIGIAVLGFRGLGWAPGEGTATAEGSRGARVGPSAAVLRFSLWAIGISGFAALSYEVLWTRMLSIYLQSTVYSFTVLLTTFLCGLALGSLLFGRLSNRMGNHLLVFGLVQMGIGVTALFLVDFSGRLPDLLIALRSRVGPSWWGIVGITYLISFSVMLPPSVLMGGAFPLISRFYSRSLTRLGREIGEVYWANTLGAILGSFVAGFVIIPLLGTQKGALSVVMLNLLLGATAGWVASSAGWRRIALVAGVIAAIAFGFVITPRRPVVLPPSVGRTPGREDRLLFYKETATGTVTVVRDERSGLKACWVDNNTVCGTAYDALQVVRMLGHLPTLAHPDPKNVLIIGFGIGVTTSAVACHGVETIECVEICPAVAEASRYFKEVNRGVLSDPRVKLIEGDGRNYLLVTPKSYDVISCDPTHPVLGSGALYAKDYFELCWRRLKEDGVLCQYLPLRKLSPEDFRTVVKTFQSVFPHTSIWLGFSHGTLLGTKGEQRIDFRSLSHRLSDPKIKADLAESNLEDPYLFLSCFIAGEETVERCVRDAAINSDNRPRLEFSGPRSLGADTWASNFSNLRELREYPGGILTGIDESEGERLRRCFAGRGHAIRARLFRHRRMLKEEIEEYERALAINPNDRETAILLEQALARAAGR